MRYLQTNFMKLSGQLRIVNRDGTALDDGVNVCPVDYFGQMWVSKVQVLVNNMLVSDSGADYGLKVLAQTVLNYDDSALPCRLKSAGFEGDNALVDEAGVLKPGWERIAPWAALRKHKSRFSGSKWVEFCSDLNVDMFRTNREWPNGVNLDIRVFRKPDDFFIMAEDDDDGDYRFEIKNLELQIRKVQPNQAVVAANNEAIERIGAKYQFNSWDMHQMYLYAGNKSFNSLSLFRGYIPSKTVYFFIDADAFKGTVKKNPLIFKNWGLKKFVQNINGVSAPTRPLVFDWPSENISDSYSAVFDGTGISSMNRGNLVTYAAFKQARFMLVYDNTCDGANYYDFAR